MGNGSTVLRQSPGSDDYVSGEHAKIILFTENDNQTVTVPSLTGLKIDEAARLAINSGLNIKISGSLASGTVVSQSLPLGAIVTRGSIITLVTLETDFED